MILYRSRFGEATKMKRQNSISGCGSAWLERLVWDQEVAGSNPVTPTTCGCSSMVEHQPSKLDTWVRFPSPALVQGYRSGHNEAVLKTVCPPGRVGSNPTPCAFFCFKTDMQKKTKKFLTNANEFDKINELLIERTAKILDN